MREVPGFRRLGDDRSPGEVVVVAEDFAAEALDIGLAEPGGLERLLSKSGERLPGGRQGTWVLTLPESGRRVHVRPLVHGGLFRRLTQRRLRSLERPLAELDAAARLRERGAPVPCPVFAVGRRTGLFWEADLATVFVAHSASAGDFLRGRPSPEAQLDAATAAGRAVRRFHDAGGSHPDLHVDNLLVRTDGAGDPVVVSDLDRVEIVPDLSPARRMSQLMRLYRSLIKQELLAGTVGERGCDAFFRAYTGEDRELRDALLSRLPRERVRVRLHTLGYRATRHRRSG